MKLEICVFSINDVLSAIKGGADRLELCASYLEGGITPSHATITETFKYFDSENVVLMIRPRGGNFIYSDAEFEVMKKDIVHCKELGVMNVIFGIIKGDGNLDITRNKQLVDLASPMHCTLQRAFDLTTDPFNALEDAINCGFKRILTSGQQASVLQGTQLIKQLIEVAENRIDILPGAGITSENVLQLIEETGCVEVHTSAKMYQKTDPDQTFQFREGIYDFTKLIVTDADEVNKIKVITNQFSS